MTQRKQWAQAFLDRAGWGAADRAFLAGDASDRSYDRLTRGTDRAVLMDAPPGKGDDPAIFVAIATHLAGLGLSPPRVLAQDFTTGFLLLEDLGDDLGQYDLIVALTPASQKLALDLTKTSHVTVEFWPIIDPTALGNDNREAKLAAGNGH